MANRRSRIITRSTQVLAAERTSKALRVPCAIERSAARGCPHLSPKELKCLNHRQDNERTVETKACDDGWLRAHADGRPVEEFEEIDVGSNSRSRRKEIQ